MKVAFASSQPAIDANVIGMNVYVTWRERFVRHATLKLNFVNVRTEKTISVAICVTTPGTMVGDVTVSKQFAYVVTS